MGVNTRTASSPPFKGKSKCLKSLFYQNDNVPIYVTIKVEELRKTVPPHFKSDHMCYGTGSFHFNTTKINLLLKDTKVIRYHPPYLSKSVIKSSLFFCFHRSYFYTMSLGGITFHFWGLYCNSTSVFFLMFRNTGYRFYRSDFNTNQQT